MAKTTPAALASMNRDQSKVMLTLDVAACIRARGMKTPERTPWKKSESRTLVRKAVPESHRTAEMATAA